MFWFFSFLFIIFLAGFLGGIGLGFYFGIKERKRLLDE